MKRLPVPREVKRRILKDGLRQNELRDEAFRKVIRSVPKGKVSTYGKVAAAAGYPLYHRAVTIGTDSGKREELTAMSNAGIAVCAAKAHDWATATPAFTSAADDLEALGEPMYAAITRQKCAELLGADGKRDEARTQAKRALALLKDQPPPADQVRAELTDWLEHN